VVPRIRNGRMSRMTEPADPDVPVDEVLTTPATPGAEALPSTDDGEDDAESAHPGR